MMKLSQALLSLSDFYSEKTYILESKTIILVT
jgi:hypothetical protein